MSIAISPLIDLASPIPKPTIKLSSDGSVVKQKYGQPTKTKGANKCSKKN